MNLIEKAEDGTMLGMTHNSILTLPNRTSIQINMMMTQMKKSILLTNSIDRMT